VGVRPAASRCRILHLPRLRGRHLEVPTEWLFLEWLSKPAWMWVAFITIVIVLLAFDLGLLRRDGLFILAGYGFAAAALLLAGTEMLEALTGLLPAW
jgi:small-conductance mechanosensitive channel